MAEANEGEMVAPTTEGLLNENRLQTDDLDPKWVASMREKLKVEPGKIKASSARNTCSIHRVPKILRQHDEEAYEPQLISIGPFHHDKRSTNLAAMEEHKWRYLNAILTKNIENDGFEGCLSALKELEQKARECYSEEIRLDSNSFVEMMVIDGCFLIEFFRRLFFASEGHKDDPLLNLGWIRHRLFFDLLLLENQIPFLILKPLLNLMNMSFGVFLGMAITFCFTELSSMNKNYKLTKFSRLFQNQTHHLLHLLHFIVLPQIRDEREVRGNTLEMIPCASQLKEAGIKFKKSDACSFLDIEFQNGLLEIPPLQIGDGVNCLFRNLIAFEQCYPHCNSHFTTYVTFMDFIINSAKDVEILNRSGIIDNWLGSDEDIAVTFNKMGNGLWISSKNFYLRPMFKEINRYYGTRWHRWRANLMRNYFKNPWLIISLIAAAILLLLTATQTFFAAFPAFAYGN